jgi:hypothetical protein
MKKTTSIAATILVIVYLLIGLGIDRYNEYQDSQNESFVEGLARENNRYSPSHLAKIIFWPFYF